jgi:hypothetical protein
MDGMKRTSGLVLGVGMVVALVAVPLGRQVTTSTTVPSTSSSTAPSTSTSTSTTALTTTSTAVTTTTTAPSTTSTSSTTTTTVPAKRRSGSGVSGTTIGLIIGAIAAAIVVLLLALLLIRRQRRARWNQDAQIAVQEGSRLLATVINGLPTLAEPQAAAAMWSRVETLGAPLHRRLQTLATAAPDQATGEAAKGADRALEALRAATDSDRALRLGPPPPTQEQLGYSAAVLRQRAADLEQAIGELDRVSRRD